MEVCIYTIGISTTTVRRRAIWVGVGRGDTSLVRVSCGGESERPTLFDFILFTIESPPGAGGDVECEARVLMDASRYLRQRAQPTHACSDFAAFERGHARYRGLEFFALSICS